MRDLHYVTWTIEKNTSMVWRAPRQHHLILSQPSKVLSGWESVAPELLEQHVARGSVCFPSQKRCMCFGGFRQPYWCWNFLKWGKNEKCHETPIAAFGRTGGSGRKSHPTWIGRAYAQRGPRPAQSHRRSTPAGTSKTDGARGEEDADGATRWGSLDCSCGIQKPWFFVTKCLTL